MQNTIMTPVLALVIWTLVMWIWLYAMRIPAMQKAKVDASKLKGPETHAALERIPPHVHWPAQNYTHLLEQPVIFYAICIYSFLVGVADDLNVWLAWGYVALRVVHSLIQSTTNYVPARFVVFTLSSILLTVIVARNAWAAFV